MRVLFDSIDVDGSGAIDVEELQTALEMMGIKQSMAEVQEMMDSVDEDGSGGRGAGRGGGRRGEGEIVGHEKGEGDRRRGGTREGRGEEERGGGMEEERGGGWRRRGGGGRRGGRMLSMGRGGGVRKGEYVGRGSQGQAGALYIQTAGRVSAISIVKEWDIRVHLCKQACSVGGVLRRTGIEGRAAGKYSSGWGGQEPREGGEIDQERGGGEQGADGREPERREQEAIQKT